MAKLDTNIQKVIDLIRDGNSWCREWESQKLSGEKCNFDDTEAKKWCLIGAMMKVAGQATEDYFAMYNLFRSQIQNVSHFNDTSKHKDVIKFLEGCLALAKAHPEKAKAA